MDDQTQELVTAESIASLQKFNDDTFNQVAKSGNFLKRLQLNTAKAQICQDGKFPINHYAMIDGDNHDDVGAQVDILPIAWRPKAIDMSGDEVICSYDANDPTYAKIQEKAGIKDSKCMFGPEFLCWLPCRKEFVTLFMGSISARREAGSIRTKLGKPVTLTAVKVETKEYTWFAIKALNCSTPFGLPEVPEMMKIAETFNNPPKQEIEPGERKTETTRER